MDIYIRTTHYAMGEFLTAHTTRKSAIEAWAKEIKCNPNEIVTKCDPAQPDTEDIYYPNTSCPWGAIIRTPLRP